MNLLLKIKDSKLKGYPDKLPNIMPLFIDFIFSNLSNKSPPTQSNRVIY